MNIRGLQTYKKYGTALLMVLIAAILTLIAASGLFRAVDLAASDAFYQSRSASDGKIVLVGIDQKALEEIGSYNHGDNIPPPLVIRPDFLQSLITSGGGILSPWFWKR